MIAYGPGGERKRKRQTSFVVCLVAVLLFLLLLPLLFTRSAYERGNSLGAQSQPGSHGGV